MDPDDRNERCELSEDEISRALEDYMKVLRLAALEEEILKNALEEKDDAGCRQAWCWPAPPLGGAFGAQSLPFRSLAVLGLNRFRPLPHLPLFITLQAKGDAFHQQKGWRATDGTRQHRSSSFGADELSVSSAEIIWKRRSSKN